MSDIPLGRPLQTVRLESTETVETPVLAEQKPVKQEEHIQPRSINESEMPSSGRPGDNAFGRPLHVPPPESGSSQYSLADLEREAVQAEVGELFTQPIKLPLGWISGFWLLILLFGGIIGWFMLAQIISTTHSILQLPLGLQIPAWGLVGFFSFLTIYPLMRLWLSYRRLRPVQQIHMTRVVTQGLSVTQLQSARQTISTYLKNYSFENNSLRKELESIGLSAAEQQKLQSLQQDLLENALMSTDVWLKEFEQAFLAPLDKLAKTRIDYHAKRLGLKTALSPNALLDMVLVLHSGFSLLHEICVLYQVRVGTVGTVYLLGLVIAQSYVAGRVQQNLVSMERIIENLTEGALGIFGAKTLSALSTRASEAALHYIFLRRIGYSMMQRLRPLVNMPA